MICDARDTSLSAIFADEALLHLASMTAGLDALASTDGAARRALLAPMLDALHTLAGAARAVERDDLEWLCRALEAVFQAAAGSLVPFDCAQSERLRQAVAVAGQLASHPGARSRNQALALIAQLDSMARQLAVPAPA